MDLSIFLVVKATLELLMSFLLSVCYQNPSASQNLAYLPSYLHFLRNLCQGTLSSENFFVLLYFQTQIKVKYVNMLGWIRTFRDKNMRGPQKKLIIFF